jgi:hypothetical protein
MERINYINAVIMFVGVVITSLGISMNSKINDTNKNSEKEIEDIKNISLILTIVFSVLLGLTLLGIGLATSQPAILMRILQFKIIIGIVILIEIICIAISASILTIIDDKTIDNETKDDKINVSSQIMYIIGICLIGYTSYSFFQS